jgi:sarcosine oxidase subunit beta
MEGDRQVTAGRPSCAVVGAGVVGLAVALHLLEAGVDVTVFERTGVAAGASGVQPGGVRQQWGTRANCLMAQESVRFYADFPNRYDTLARARLDRCGYLFVAHQGATLRRLEANIAVQHELGIRSELLTPEEAAERVPSLNPEGLAGAAYCRDDGYFDRPQAVVEAFAEVVVRLGGRIEIRAVESVRRHGDGWQLDFEAGASLRVENVVVAAAQASVSLLAPLGHVLPIQPEPRYLFYSEHIRERLLEPLVIAVDLGLAAKQLANGRVLASDLHASGSLDANEAHWRRRIREMVVELLPILEYVSLPIVVAGDYDMTPDGQPIVDRLEDGLWVAAGFSGHGFMVAPAVGRMIATTLSGGGQPEWANAVRADRFASVLETVEAQVI